MTLAQFSKLAKGLNDGQDFSHEFLNNIYESIKAKPLALH
jgi:Sec7-like guanine-nucleotide exchange factor